MGIYDLLNEIEHPESLTVEEALELMSLASVAALSDNLFSDDVLTWQRHRIEQNKRSRPARVPKPAVKVLSTEERHRKNCQICALNHEISLMFGTPKEEILNSSTFNRLKARLEHALTEMNKSPTVMGRLTVTYLVRDIRSLLTRSIGEHHA